MTPSPPGHPADPAALASPLRSSPLLSSPLQRGPGAPPRQRQLIQRLKQAILAGQLPAGGKLPSSRALSEDLEISRNTVLIAYEQLTAEGYVIADRQGTRVAALSAAPLSAAAVSTGAVTTAALSTAALPTAALSTPSVSTAAVTTAAVSTAALSAALEPAGRAARAARAPDSSSPPAAHALATATRLSRIVSTRSPVDSSLPMTPGTPALTQFPINAWRRAQDRALQAAPAATLGYGHPIGEPALREAIAQYLRVSRGV
ncbi:MAG: GntR family transcriptional regulator, partial [Achromobacter kerstersii]|uniref:GntR family transcriptional regulator n=1 Tax=Achromobacter kerstersii TaxID=1353890 RepID=UPI003D0172C5